MWNKHVMCIFVSLCPAILSFSFGMLKEWKINTTLCGLVIRVNWLSVLTNHHWANSFLEEMTSLQLNKPHFCLNRTVCKPNTTAIYQYIPRHVKVKPKKTSGHKCSRKQTEWKFTNSENHGTCFSYDVNFSNMGIKLAICTQASFYGAKHSQILWP